MWLCFLGGMYLHPLYAGSYPMITNINMVDNGARTDYTFGQTLVDIGASTETLANRKYICFGHRHAYKDGNSYAACIFNSPIKSGETIGQAARRLHTENNIGNVTTILRMGGVDPHVSDCIGYFAIDSEITATYPNWSLWSSAVYPAGSCASTPTVSNWCKLISPTLVLDHGAISLTQAEGHSAEDSLSIQCNSSATVQLKLVGGLDYIPLTPNGKAYLSIDGKAPGSVISLPYGNSTLAVTDKLSNLSQSGVYYGSSILVLEPF